MQRVAEPGVQRGRGRRHGRWRAAWRTIAACVAMTMAGCGVTPDATIADEFHERLQAPPRGFRARQCPGLRAKVEELRDLVWLAHDLRARIRDFDTMPPPQLHDRMMQHPLRGRAADYRCIVQDFGRREPSEQADFLDALPLVANLYVLKARVLLARGELQAGWAHMVDALALYAEPTGFGLEQYLSLLEVLRAIPPLLQHHRPDLATVAQLVDALEATRITTATICGGVRHDLLTLAVTGFRVHFGRREKEAMAQRFGLDHAMRTWRSPWPGKLGRAEWSAWRDTYDGLVDGCAQRPLGLGLQGVAQPMLRLDSWHPPTAVRLRMIVDRFNRMALLVDTQITQLATVRALQLRGSLGREPTTAELALSFGRRPTNPWDRRHYTFVVSGGVLSVVRGPYRHEVALPAD